MKVLTFLLIGFLLISCEKELEDTVPSYIKINKIVIDDDKVSSNIVDAWVYLNDNLQGVYELPAHFPILTQGNQSIRVKAGIKVNGISSTRSPYPFYTSFLDTFNLKLNETTTIDSIKLNYLPNTEFEFNEDFEGFGFDFSSSGLSDTSLNVVTDSAGNKMAYVIIRDSFLTFEASTIELNSLPQGGASVFLELDYKATSNFVIGTYTAFPQGIVQKEIMEIFPKEEWNKIYINLTNTISEGIGAAYFKIYIGMQRPSISEEVELYFDNFKVIY